MVLPGVHIGFLRRPLDAPFRSADVVQLGILNIVDQGAGELREQGVVEVVALVDQMLVEFAQGVLLQS